MTQNNETIIAAVPAPPVDIPDSANAVHVSIIDTTARLTNIPTRPFINPIYPGTEKFAGPAYSFLITHPPTGRKLLFDLGVRKDPEHTLSPRNQGLLKSGWEAKVDKDVAEILEENGVNRGDIEAIIWSHWHWDHVGDPSTFPGSTDLIVGPGFKENFLPGYPAQPEAAVLESDFAGRQVRELDFSNKGIQLGDFEAIDYFGDGSFYLLSTPGHTIGHLSGLARTTAASVDPPNKKKPASFIFMGGDICHHAGQFRPTVYLPLPENISPDPLSMGSLFPCPGAMFEQIHWKKSATAPFMEIAENGVAHDTQQARKSLRKVDKLDGTGDVFVVIAHDASLLDVVEFFPKEANDWREKGWGESARWRFLSWFKTAVDETEAKTKGKLE